MILINLDRTQWELTNLTLRTIRLKGSLQTSDLMVNQKLLKNHCRNNQKKWKLWWQKWWLWWRSFNNLRMHTFLVFISCLWFHMFYSMLLILMYYVLLFSLIHLLLLLTPTLFWLLFNNIF